MNKALYSVLIICFLFSGVRHVFAQAPVIRWEKCIGGGGNDYAYSIKQTIDSGYIVTGSSNSTGTEVTGNHGNYDAWVVKLSPTGIIEWQRSLGGTDLDVSISVALTYDSGYIIAGSTASNNGDVTVSHGGTDAWLIKLSATGALQWQKTFGGSGEDYGASVQQTTDSGYIFAAYSTSANGDLTKHYGSATTSDYWIIKVSPSGTMQWQKTLGGTGNDYTTSVKQTTDGNFIVAGYSTSNDSDVTGSHGSDDFWIVKLSTTGNMLWQKALGGTGSDFANAVVETADGKYVVAGGSNSADGDITAGNGMGDGWMVKLSATGSMVWQKSFGGIADDAINGLTATADSCVLVSGWAASNMDSTFRGSADYWLMKVNSSGTKQWQRCMGSLGNDVAWSAVPLMDGGYAMAGYTFYHSGDVSMGLGLDYWIVNLAMPVVNSVNTVSDPRNISVIPNPATNYITVSGISNATVRIWNAVGQFMTEAKNTTDVSVAQLPSGMYLVRVYDERGVIVYNDKILKN